MPLITDRLVVGRPPITETAFDFSKVAENGVDFQTGDKGYTNTNTREYTFASSNPGLATAAQVFGYTGTVEDKGSTGVYGIAIDLGKLPFLVWEEDKLKGVLVNKELTLEAKLSLSRIILKYGTGTGANYTPTKLAAVLVDHVGGEGSTVSSVGVSPEVLSVNSNVFTTDKLQVWNFDVGDLSFDAAGYKKEGRLLMLYPVTESTGKKYATANFRLACYKNDGKSCGVGVTNLGGKLNTTIFPYGEIELALISSLKMNGRAQEFNVSIPLLTGKQMKKLFEFLTDSETTITKGG